MTRGKRFLREVQFVLLVCALAAVLFIVGLGFQFLLESPTERNQQLGTILIGALSRYHDDYGRYPGSLDDLTPTYLSVIPTPRGWGMEWEYRTFDDGAVFRIAFYSDSRGSIAGNYRSDEGSWVLID